VQRKAQRRKDCENFVKLCQEGIEQVHRVHMSKNSILSSEIREV
jgi:hypothetical protein